MSVLPGIGGVFARKTAGAAPAIADGNYGTAANTTGINLPLPSLVVGHILLVAVTQASGTGAGVNMALPAGWNYATYMSDNSISTAMHATMVIWKVCDGTEGGSVSIVRSGGAQAEFAGLSLRLSGVALPTPQAASNYSNSTAVFDPSAVVLPWGPSFAALAFVALGEWASTVVPSNPTGYTLYATLAVPAQVHARISLWYAPVAAASVDPPATNVNNTISCQISTVVFRGT